MVGGSFGLREFTQIRYDAQKIKKKVNSQSHTTLKLSNSVCDYMLEATIIGVVLQMDPALEARVSSHTNTDILQEEYEVNTHTNTFKFFKTFNKSIEKCVCVCLEAKTGGFEQLEEHPWTTTLGELPAEPTRAENPHHQKHLEKSV